MQLRWSGENYIKAISYSNRIKEAGCIMELHMRETNMYKILMKKPSGVENTKSEFHTQPFTDLFTTHVR
jgi:hypothetical protein